MSGMVASGRCLLTMEDLTEYAEEVRHGFQETIAAVHSALRDGFRITSLDDTSSASTNVIAFALPVLDEVRAVELELRPVWERRSTKKRGCVVS